MSKVTAIDRKPAILQGISIIDADTHVTEVADLWTSRAPAKYKDRVPQMKVRDGALCWVIDGDKFLFYGNPVSAVAPNGAKAHEMEFVDWRIKDVHPGSYDLQARLKFMDEVGVKAQVIYPNVVGFGGQGTASVDKELRYVTTKIYNDAMAEMQAASNGRLYPMILVPWWDIDQALAEIKRCHKLGMRGINTNSDPQLHDMPSLAEDYWYPLWELCSELDLPVNFHIGGSEISMAAASSGMWFPNLSTKQFACGSTMTFIANSRVLSNLIISLVLERFSKLKVVSVESGVGWIPFQLESIEYMMREMNIKYQIPPHEIFKRQMYACSWFERRNFPATARMLGIDNVMFETDFPHPTCLHPDALEYIAAVAAEFTLDERKKVFGGTASHVYNIPIN